MERHLLQHAVLLLLILMDGVLHDNSLYIPVYHKELLIFNMGSIYHEAYVHLMDISCVQSRGRIFFCAALQAAFGALGRYIPFRADGNVHSGGNRYGHSTNS